jgi:hypothetical protein
MSSTEVATMKKLGLLLSATGMLLTASQVFALDVSEGTVLAFDRKANVLIFTDKTVWPLEKLVSALPADLNAGDRVRIQYDSNEDDGITAIHSIVAMPK